MGIEETIQAMKKRIKEVKREKGFSHEELSEISGIPRGTLAKTLGTETKDPRVSFIIKISKALECSPDYLLFGEDEEEIKCNVTAEQQLLNHFEELNQVGQERLLETIEEMLELAKYKK